MSLIYTILLVTLLNGHTCEILRGKQGFGLGQQDWDYVEVRPMAHMFWWLYYAAPPVQTLEFDPLERPLIIWLQGGPGGSGTGFGNFEEFGPLNTDLQPRNYSWVDDYNILFIDSPVGTGLGYVDSNDAFAKDNFQMADDLVECMRGLFKKIPEFKTIPTYIVGESYGGKVAVEFAWSWSMAQANKTIESNLTGIALGDSSISPIDFILAWSPFLLNHGLIDYEGAEEVARHANMTKEAVDARDYDKAFQLRSETEDIIDKRTNNVDFYNILKKSSPLFQEDLEHEKLFKLMNGPVQKALGLNVSWESVNRLAQQAIKDRMRSVVTRVDAVLDHTNLKVFVYSGQLDLLISTPATLAWLQRLRWKGAEAWKKAPKLPLVIDDVVEGYKKNYDKLTMYWINRSGHMVPKDNPQAACAMLSDLTSTMSINADRYFYME